MPIYEYECTACKYKQEEIRKLENRDDVADCEVCHQVALRVEISKTYFGLKGTGWHDKMAGWR